MVRGIQMKAGSCDIMLGQDDFAKGRDRRKGDGFRLWVATVQDIITLAARVKAKGWTLDREPSETPWGDWAFALTDPDGFKITVIQEEQLRIGLLTSSRFWPGSSNVFAVLGRGLARRGHTTTAWGGY